MHSSGLRTPVSMALLGCYVLNAVVHLVTQFAGLDALARVTQAVAMPLLIALVLTAGIRSRLVWLAAAALVFSWLGDVLPGFVASDVRFLVLVGCFFLAQIAYTAAFLPYLRRSVATTPFVALYVIAFVVLLVLCAPNAGGLLIPLVVYGISLVAMAALSTGVHPLSGLGGALFLISDALIALTVLGVLAFDLQGLVIMATYLSGQVMIAIGVVLRSHQPANGRALVESPRSR